MNPKIETTSNYSLFNPNEEQRKVDNGHVKKLSESMSLFGFMPHKPILCYKYKGKLVIVDGHHRLAAAKAVKIPVFYIVQETSCQREMVATSEAKQWSVVDCIRLYALRGNKDYAELQSYAQYIPITMAASILSGSAAESTNQRRALRDGSWRIKTREHLKKIIEVISSLQEKNSAVKSREFVSVLSKCLFAPEFDFDHFSRKLASFPLMLEKTSNEDQMMKLVEDIYNYKSQNKIPLAFIVSKNSKDRQNTFGKKSP